MIMTPITERTNIDSFPPLRNLYQYKKTLFICSRGKALDEASSWCSSDLLTFWKPDRLATLQPPSTAAYWTSTTCSNIKGIKNIYPHTALLKAMGTQAQSLISECLLPHAVHAGLLTLQTWYRHSVIWITFSQLLLKIVTTTSFSTCRNISYSMYWVQWNPSIAATLGEQPLYNYRL